MSEPRRFYMVATFCPWSSIEPAPGSLMRYPVVVDGCGDGFFKVYFDRDEAVKEADGDETLVLKCVGRVTP